MRRASAVHGQANTAGTIQHTISFQAAEFYARNGWTRFGEIPCDPPGTSRIFMTKSL